MKKMFSIVLPIYKNEENLPVTIPYILEHLNLFETYDVELIMVCDGSPDHSYEIMQEYQAQYPDIIRIAGFVRNCGQRAAVNCGMSLARGDVIGVISADLQDPFELFAEMLKYWEQGHKLVIGRRENRAEKGIQAVCSKMLHKFIHRYINKEYPVGGFDFFITDKSVAQAFTKADTINNSMQLLLLEIAGKSVQLDYYREKRTLGTSGWLLSKKVNQTVNIITGYSAAPFVFFAGLGIFMFAVSLIFWIIKLTDLIGYGFGHGLAGIYASIFLVGGVLAEGIAITGIYLFKGLQNLRKLPRYVMDNLIDEGEDTAL